VIGHQRSPIKTTHNDLRLAVEELSGGLPLTIYADCWKSARLGSDKFFRELTKSQEGTGDAEKRPSVNVEEGAGLAVQEGRGRNRETGNARNVGQPPDRPQPVLRWHPLLHRYLDKHPALLFLASAHSDKTIRTS